MNKTMTWRRKYKDTELKIYSLIPPEAANCPYVIKEIEARFLELEIKLDRFNGESVELKQKRLADLLKSPIQANNRSNDSYLKVFERKKALFTGLKGGRE